eukprot:CAMPEP_0201523432 /NCGR_PEP_ID=MMETSP0161_2-20130828/19839_1 /ASSEMBLY_ACC=CAM_ASM_000251 /TAXON_ID=180227 /ORGANISM="Neoparamoeba aestuarina, Strain SoJaBio B1-5/56/2" /LENGTH=586 /DNA_ID=CAMNT_0047922547 /DNA_START=36 /DNA_END=1796 /DNA_ORIENTATION=+
MECVCYCYTLGGLAALAVLYFLFKLITRKPLPPLNVKLTELEASTEVHVSSEVSREMDLKDPSDPTVVRCYDPATGCFLGTVKNMTEEEVNECARKAKNAQAEWRNTTWEQRRRVLRLLMNYTVEHQLEICRVDARDSGKPMVDAVLGEIMTTCEKISYVLKHGEAVLKPEKRPTSLVTIHKNAYLEFYPLGVIGVIAPWNYPYHNFMNHIISGIFAGNGIVVKVSEYTSWSSSYYLRIVQECLKAEGHNPDLVQVITGFGGTGAALVASPLIDKVVFTGSPQVGKLVMAGASKHLKPVVLELGGKDPMIILEDAKVDDTIPIVLRGTYQNSGQNCCGIERVIVHEQVYDEFLDKVLKKVKNFRQGPALGKETIDVAAMVTPQQLGIVQELVDDAVKRGARLLIGGKVNPNLPNGLFYEPTILADVTPEMRIAQEEVFGPVMSVFKIKGDEEAIHVANGCAFGLGGCVFCKSDTRGAKIGQQLQCGSTCVNDFATTYLVQSLPFGGVKNSGFGKFGGPEGLRDLCLQKSVCYDIVPFVRTEIPGIMQFPIKKESVGFGSSLVGLIYGSGIGMTINSLFGVISPKAK